MAHPAPHVTPPVSALHLRLSDPSTQNDPSPLPTHLLLSHLGLQTVCLLLAASALPLPHLHSSQLILSQ